MLPLARKEGLHVEEVSDELMVYDVARHKAHCLGPTAGSVWRNCNGRMTAEEISDRVREEGTKIDEEMTWMILHRLGKLDLLHEKVALPKNAICSSRRDLMRKVLGACGVCFLLATTVLAPTAARAKSDGPRRGGHGHASRHDHDRGRGHGWGDDHDRGGRRQDGDNR